MANSRSRTEITCQILEIANGEDGFTKTEMMYKVLLGLNQLQEYLTLLIENDFLSCESTTHKFKTTEKGLSFLQAYNRMDQILKKQQV
ncbi:MAG TPA: winged helix-turn-helix domain-containing protein [Nitrososphaera sp.]|nr:winged helix-turn-helix domain-containing protein [Nitrososphaera sp.]